MNELEDSSDPSSLDILDKLESVVCELLEVDSSSFEVDVSDGIEPSFSDSGVLLGRIKLFGILDVKGANIQP